MPNRISLFPEESGSNSENPTDEDLEAVCMALQNFQGLEALVSTAIRDSIDTVIDGPRTMRWSIEQLEKTEKTHLGLSDHPKPATDYHLKTGQRE